LRLIYPDQDKRLVLRLWAADVQIDGNDCPLFVGTIEEQRSRTLAGLISMARNTGEYERPLKALKLTIDDRFAVASVSRAGREVQVHTEHFRGWQGEVLLAGPGLSP
jgi:hypothetical protein